MPTTDALIEESNPFLERLRVAHDHARHERNHPPRHDAIPARMEKIAFEFVVACHDELCPWCGCQFRPSKRLWPFHKKTGRLLCRDCAEAYIGDFELGLAILRGLHTE